MMNKEKQTVLVVGCGGFIGSHLLERLLDVSGFRVIGIDHSAGKIAHLLDHPGLDFRRTGIENLEDLPHLVDGVDAVIHLAALCNPSLYNTRPLEVIDVNFMQAVPVVKACSEGGKRLLHFSTCEVYGKSLAGFAPEGSEFAEDPAHCVLSEDSSPLILGPVSRQRWCYSAAKQLIERLIFAEGEVNGLDYTIIRPFNVIGPRMDYIPGVDGEGIPRVVPSFMRALLFSEDLKLVDGGRSRRTFIHVNDAIDAVVRMIEQPANSRRRIFNIGNPGNETSMAGLAQMMMDIFAEKTGRPLRSRAVEVPGDKFYGKGYDDCDRRIPDISSAGRLLGWRPSIGLHDLLSSVIEWYLDKYGNLIE